MPPTAEYEGTIKLRRQKQYSHFIWSCLALTICLWGYTGLVGEVGVASPQPKHPKKKIIQKPSCDFKVDIKETDFYLVKGAVYDIAVALIPTAGVCKGSATISVSGLPPGVTHTIFPSPKMKFIRSPKASTGTAVATVRIDTSRMTLEEMATSSLIFTASQKSLIRKAKANMIIDIPNEKTDQAPSCDFKVELAEPNFCVIQGMVHEIDVTLTPIAGVCEGPATISVSGLPPGVTKEILPSPKVMFTSDATAPAGIAVATVRIDTAGITLEEMATSSVTFAAVKKGLTRTDKVEMTIDMPSFDFSIKANPNMLKVPQENEDSAIAEVEVKLLGSACRSIPPVDISLRSSSLPSTVSHSFSSASVLPPAKTTISFRAGPAPEIGAFKATIVGCCTDEQEEKKTEITLDVTFPSNQIHQAGAEFPGASRIGNKFTSHSLEDILKIFNLPPEAQEASQKAQKDSSEKGYIEASEGEVEGLKFSKTLVQPIDQAIGFLTFEPASLENTPFKGFRLEGGYHYNNVREKFAALTRIFAMLDGAIVALTEWDYPTSGGGSIYAKEFINENINGSPARLTVQQSQSGKALTTMVWETAKISYTLQMEGHVKRTGQYELFLALARSIVEDRNVTKNDKNGASIFPDKLIPK